MASNGPDRTLTQIGLAGKKAGLQVWRIENFSLVPQPREQYGNFYTGDSYILLKTISTRGIHFRYDLHFWLGDNSSADERGTAAILSIKIDDALGGYPVQYRELQGFETPTFMGYFKNGVKYQKGGVASGFTHAKTNISDVKRVLHIKGRRSVRAVEVDMSWKSFNQGDCFIVEVENNIYQWNGSGSNKMERFKACEIANFIKSDEKAGKGKLFIVEEGRKYPKEMLEVLSGSPSDIQAPIEDDDKMAKSKAKGSKATLYQVSSDSGPLITTKLGTAPFNQSSLDSGDCFIVDTGSGNTIFVWKGRKASKDERSGSLKNAANFITEKKYVAHTKIQVVNDSAEPALFTQYFNKWVKKDQTVGFGQVYSNNKIAKIEQVRFEMKSLHDKPKLAAKHGMVDDGSGKVQVWRVEGSKKVAVNPSNYGKFFAGDSYIILYTYTPKCREEYIIYYWQGLESTIDETTASAYLATQLDDEYDQRPVQVRVVQGKEPNHFMSIFKTPLIITSGGYSRKAGKEVGMTEVALYQVRSTQMGGTKAIQLEAKASSLNSNDTFVLKTKKICYVWAGIGASKVERDTAEYVAGQVSDAKHKVVHEKKEPPIFWKILGGKLKYADSPRLLEDLDENPARLFAISNAKGKVTVEEVPGAFTQSDLAVDDVMMLDTWNEVFLWIGHGANSEERREAPSLAADYIKSDPRGRDQDCPIITMKMENEPVTFKGYFPAWDSKLFRKNLDYETRLRGLVGQSF